MDPMLSFGMALGALLISVVNVVVTIVNFRKSAGQVVVEMTATLLNPARSLLTNDDGTWGINPQSHGTTGVELAKVVIENPGRTGATITKVQFRIEGSSDSDLAMGVTPIAVKQLGDTTTAVDLPHRLEPYDQVVYLLDFWSVVNQVFAEEPQLRQISIWASVKVAGQPQPYGSKDHGHWTIRREWVSLVAPYARQSAQNILLSALMNVFIEPGQNPYLMSLAGRIEDRISPDSSSVDITQALQQVVGPGGEFNSDILGEYNIMAFIGFGFDVRKRFDDIGPNVIWSRSGRFVQ